MNKIALCFSGLPSLEVKAVDIFLKKMSVTPAEVDFIACFWNINANKNKIQNFAKRFNSSQVTYIEPEIPNISFLKNYLKFPETNVGRVLSMFFLRKKLLEIIRNQNKIYHSYIISRPDIFIEKELNIFSFIRNFDGGKGGCNFYLPYAGNHRNGLTDILVFADYSGVEVYLSVIDKLEYILNSRDRYVYPINFFDWVKEVYSLFNLFFSGRINYVNRVPFHPENLIRKNIELSDLKIGYVDTGDIFIIRNLGVSKMTVIPAVPTFLLARSMVLESINDVDITIETIFNSKLVFPIEPS
jgi:hypothetical protein